MGMSVFVILSEARNLVVRWGRSFAALRMTLVISRFALLVRHRALVARRARQVNQTAECLATGPGSQPLTVGRRALPRGQSDELRRESSCRRTWGLARD